MWVELLIGWSKFLSRHDQSEALPRSRKWYVISMDSESLQWLLRRYSAGKPVVARFVKLSEVIEFVPSQRLWINVAGTQLVQLQHSMKLYGQYTLYNKIPSQIFSWFCVYSSKERQASKKCYNKCFENSRSQIVFRTDIFRKMDVGCPCLDHEF